MSGNVRSTVGTYTEIYTFLRLLFSRIGQPSVGYSDAFSFNHPQGKCEVCDGLGFTKKINLTYLIDFNQSLNEDPIDLPGLVLQYQKEELAANDMHESNTFEDPNHLRAVIVEQRNNVSANELFDISIKPMSVSVFKIVLG